jgi:hypothetical protein
VRRIMRKIAGLTALYKTRPRKLELTLRLTSREQVSDLGKIAKD